jgi:hypothetical protein
MTWDAIAAILVVFLAVALLIRHLRADEQVCSKCEVVVTQKRVLAAQQSPVTQKPLSELALSRPRNPSQN